MSTEKTTQRLLSETLDFVDVMLKHRRVGSGVLKFVPAVDVVAVFSVNTSARNFFLEVSALYASFGTQLLVERIFYYRFKVKGMSSSSSSSAAYVETLTLLAEEDAKKERWRDAARRYEKAYDVSGEIIHLSRAAHVLLKADENVDHMLEILAKNFTKIADKNIFFCSSLLTNGSRDKRKIISALRSSSADSNDTSYFVTLVKLAVDAGDVALARATVSAIKPRDDDDDARTVVKWLTVCVADDFEDAAFDAAFSSEIKKYEWRVACLDMLVIAALKKYGSASERFLRAMTARRECRVEKGDEEEGDVSMEEF